MTHTPTHMPTSTPQREQSIRVPVLWGLAFGAIQAASPLAIWWLDQATVQALLLALTEPYRTSPAPNTSGRLVSNGRVDGAAAMRPGERRGRSG
jgi:hypothetical protein